MCCVSKEESLVVLTPEESRIVLPTKESRVVLPTKESLVVFQGSELLCGFLVVSSSFSASMQRLKGGVQGVGICRREHRGNFQKCGVSRKGVSTHACCTDTHVATPDPRYHWTTPRPVRVATQWHPFLQHARFVFLSLRPHHD